MPVILERCSKSSFTPCKLRLLRSAPTLLTAARTDFEQVPLKKPLNKVTLILMQNSVIYALDFDGVICDSAVETGIAGWKAATQIWTDISTPMPPPPLIEQFRLVRPILETGYESILVVRMLFDGESTESILTNFPKKKHLVLENSNHNIKDLKRLFGATRDAWIQNSLAEWIEMNPLFPGVAEKLKKLPQQQWYIVTTKQERFVAQILHAYQIPIPDDRIFGMDHKKSKEEVLLALQKKHPHATLHFVEDRLPALLNVLKNNNLQDIKLFFALWGYNTTDDKLAAAEKSIKAIEIEQFLS
jgi:phosphoglycolate phosphatase-like HAD superfamily hydrolase